MNFGNSESNQTGEKGTPAIEGPQYKIALPKLYKSRETLIKQKNLEEKELKTIEAYIGQGYNNSLISSQINNIKKEIEEIENQLGDLNTIIITMESQEKRNKQKSTNNSENCSKESGCAIMGGRRKRTRKVQSHISRKHIKRSKSYRK